MFRPFAMFLAVSAVPLCTACDNGAADSRAGVPGADKADAAPSEFARAREEYRRQTEADLAALDKSIAAVEAKEAAVGAAAKAGEHNALASLKAERDAFAGDLRATDTAISSTWNATQVRLTRNGWLRAMERYRQAPSWRRHVRSWCRHVPSWRRRTPSWHRQVPSWHRHAPSWHRHAPSWHRHAPSWHRAGSWHRQAPSWLPPSAAGGLLSPLGCPQALADAPAGQG